MVILDARQFLNSKRALIMQMRLRVLIASGELMRQVFK